MQAEKSDTGEPSKDKKNLGSFIPRLKKMHHADLTKLHRALSDELARRAKEHAKNKPMGRMSSREFDAFAREQIEQAKG